MSMLEDGKKEKIAHIVHGIILEGQQDSLTTIRNLLCSSHPTSRTVKTKFQSQLIVKKEQAEFLIQYCNSHNMLLSIFCSWRGNSITLIYENWLIPIL